MGIRVLLLVVSFIFLCACEEGFKTGESLMGERSGSSVGKDGNKDDSAPAPTPIPRVEVSSEILNFYPKSAGLEASDRLYVYFSHSKGKSDLEKVLVAGLECTDLQDHVIDPMQALDEMEAGAALSAISCALPAFTNFGDRSIELLIKGNKYALSAQNFMVESSNIATAGDFDKLKRNWWRAYQLTADIDFALTERSPIKYFFGEIDGADFKISNLVVRGNSGLTGIFSVLSGTVKNLTIENSQVIHSINENDPDKVHAVGQLAALLRATGVIDNLTIENCDVDVQDVNHVAVSGGVTLFEMNSTVSDYTVLSNQEWVIDTGGNYQGCISGATANDVNPDLIMNAGPGRLTGFFGDLNSMGVYDVVNPCDLDYNMLSF